MKELDELVQCKISTPNVVDELMEDLEASNEVPEQEMDCDDETSDPS